MNAPETAEPELILLPEHQDLHDHLKYVLEQQMRLLRRTPVTGDLIEETANAFDTLEALVASLKVEQYDAGTAHGRLLNAIAQLNRTMPGVALRTLGSVYHYLATSDDDGVTTRERAMGIIQGVGLGEEGQEVGEQLLKAFPLTP